MGGKAEAGTHAPLPGDLAGANGWVALDVARGEVGVVALDDAAVGEEGDGVGAGLHALVGAWWEGVEAWEREKRKKGDAEKREVPTAMGTVALPSQ